MVRTFFNTQKGKTFTYVSFSLILFSSAYFIFIQFILESLITNAFNGTSLNYLNELISQHRLKAPSQRSLEFYLNEGPKYLFRIFFLVSYIFLILFFILRNKRLLLNSFLFIKEPALNLAILRITTILLILYTNFPRSVLLLIELGPDAIVPPIGWSKEFISLVINKPVVYTTLSIYMISMIFSLIGYRTNLMIRVFCFISFFIMGIPQFYGKIDHYQILWAVLLILSFSSSGHALSIDNLIEKKPQLNLNKATSYGLPLKIVMLLIGLSYFFPGFWKFTFSGLEWAFSDNLKYKMHSAWLNYQGWTPFFRIDKHPVLYKSSAFLTLVLELGFIFALFNKYTRYLFAGLALLFHFSVLIFMKIFFFFLISLYVVFINWAELVKKIPLLKVRNDGKFSLPKTKRLRRVASFILLANIFCGSLLINSWPFSVYPTFASIETNFVPSILIETINKEEDIEHSFLPQFDKDYISRFNNSVRLRGYLRSFLTNSKLKEEEDYELLKNIYCTKYLHCSNISSIKFYEIRLNTNPDKKEPEYIIQRELFSFKL